MGFYYPGTIKDKDIEAVYVSEVYDKTHKIKKEKLTKQKNLGLWKPDKKKDR